MHGMKWQLRVSSNAAYKLQDLVSQARQRMEGEHVTAWDKGSTFIRGSGGCAD